MTSFQLAPEPMAKQTPRIRRVPCHGDGLNLGIRPEGAAWDLAQCEALGRASGRPSPRRRAASTLARAPNAAHAQP